MRVMYLDKKNLRFFLIGLVCLLAAILGLVLIGGPAESVVADPVYQGNGQDNGVAITINVDWGEDVLPDMLTVLAEKDVKATFFVTGRFAEKFPELVTEIAASGHEIGNHGYGHPHPDQLSVADNEADILKAEAILEPLAGRKPVLFAPPYGEHGDACLQAAQNNGYTVTLWTADTVDWQQPAPDQATLVARVTGDKLQNGAILLMHPKSHTLSALPTIIDTIRDKGYTLKTVSELL